MRNLELALALERIADLLEFLEESPFKVRAYRRAARTFLELDRPVEELAAQGKLRELPGVGEAIEAKALQFLSTGHIDLLDRLLEQVPESVLLLTQIPGVGPRTARLVFQQLGIRSPEELEQAARQGRLRQVKGLGPRTEQAILEGIQQWRQRQGEISLAHLLVAGEQVAKALQAVEGVGRVVLAGSVRRARETGSDVDLVAELISPARALEGLRVLGQPDPGEWPGTWRLRASGPGGIPVDLWLVQPERFWALVWFATGPAPHVEAVQQRLHQAGLRWERGLVVGPDGQGRPLQEESELYRWCGLPWIAPELRWGEDELELADRHLLPDRLLEPEDLRGELHVHTEASDGAASALEMVEAALARGLEYVAVTDHSGSLAVAHGLSVERLKQQQQMLRELDSRMSARRRERDGEAAGIRVLAGAEVDILPEGELDYPPEVLASLDVVIASVHTHFRQERQAMTRRLVRACEEPHVHVLAHPTGRLLGRRSAYDVDLEVLLQAAARTGTALEINGSPDRLDLEARWARQARRQGVRLVVSSDAHSPAQLAFARYGVLVARRAGLGPQDVLNTLPAEQLLEELHRKGKPGR